MKAAVSTPNGLELRDIPQPVPKPNELLVRVKACGLNRADLSAARATYGHGTIGAPVGLEHAGEVVDVGAEVKGFKAGDSVVCAAGGGYAEYAVADHGRTLPIPKGLSFERAAVLPRRARGGPWLGGAGGAARARNTAPNRGDPGGGPEGGGGLCRRRCAACSAR